MPPPRPPDRGIPWHPPYFGATNAPAQPAQTPAALAAFARAYGLPLPPPPGGTTFEGMPGSLAPSYVNNSRMVPGGVPGLPQYFQLPPKMPSTGYSPADLLMEAQKEAEAYYAPMLQELRRQQLLTNTQGRQQMASIEGVYKALGGSLSGPEAEMAGNEGQLKYLQAVQDAQAANSDIASKLIDAAREQSGKVQDIFGSLTQDQQKFLADQAAAHKPIYRSVPGVGLVAIDPVTQKSTVVQGVNAPPKLITGPDGLYTWQETKTGWELVPVGPRKTTTEKPTRLSMQTINGHRWAVDPYTGEKITDLGVAGTPKSKTDTEPAPIYRQGKDGRTYLIDPVTNTATPVGGMGGIGNVTKKQKPPSVVTLRRGWDILKAAVVPQSAPLRHGKGGAPVTLAELQDIWNTHKAQWTKLGATGPNDLPRTIMDLMKSKSGASIARALGAGAFTLSPRDPQEVYRALIDAGIPAYKAWTMVRDKRFYPGRLPGYFPKGDPAAKTAETVSQTVATGNPVPLSAGKIIGYPYQGSHTLYGNWQSDNAIDFAVPTGTPVYAVADGVIGPRIGPFASQDPHLTGSRVTLTGGGNSFYYAHLSQLSVKAGQRVKKGQLLGYSGAANGVEHLHFGIEHGNPNTYFKATQQPASRTTASVKSATSPGGARRYAFSVAQKKYGWRGSERTALNQLWSRESGWKYKSRNRGSGALGIPQALGHELPSGYENDPKVQINWGLNYIKERYKTPTRAWAFWRATVNKNANIAPPDLRRVALEWISKGYAGY